MKVMILHVGLMYWKILLGVSITNLMPAIFVCSLLTMGFRINSCLICYFCFYFINLSCICLLIIFAKSCVRNLTQHDFLLHVFCSFVCVFSYLFVFVFFFHSWDYFYKYWRIHQLFSSAMSELMFKMCGKNLYLKIFWYRPTFKNCSSLKLQMRRIRKSRYLGFLRRSQIWSNMKTCRNKLRIIDSFAKVLRNLSVILSAAKIFLVSTLLTHL